MSLMIGSSAPSAVKHGAEDVKSVYAGDKLVWPSIEVTPELVMDSRRDSIVYAAYADTLDKPSSVAARNVDSSWKGGIDYLQNTGAGKLFKLTNCKVENGKRYIVEYKAKIMSKGGAPAELCFCYFTGDEVSGYPGWVDARTANKTYRTKFMGKGRDNEGMFARSESGYSWKASPTTGWWEWEGKFETLIQGAYSPAQVGFYIDVQSTSLGTIQNLDADISFMRVTEKVSRDGEEYPPAEVIKDE